MHALARTSYVQAMLLNLAVSCGGLLLALAASLWRWGVTRKPLHLAYAVAVGGWLVSMLGRSADFVFQSKPLVFFFAQASCQVGIVALLFFFLISASVIRFETHLVWMIQGLAGLLLLVWSNWGPWFQAWTFTLWVAMNSVCVNGLISYGALKVYGLGPLKKRQWLALGVSVMGLGTCLVDVPTVGPAAPANTLVDYWYAAFLLALGLVIFTRPFKWLTPLTVDAEAQSTAWSPVTGFGPQNDSVASAIAGERRRIAQDLHDGVCSQLVSILATLDSHSPQQQGLALALEQCLVDLKLMVDVIDDADDSVIDALGRLRYRVQSGPDALGIEMHWAVDACGPLQSLHGETAKQVLRIAQEGLSNVMRHSQATAVEVICSHVPADNMLLLEIHDNGNGIPRLEADRPSGKGLENMKKRARGMVGQLQISTKPGVGTRVRLLVPLSASQGPVTPVAPADPADPAAHKR